MWSVHLCIYLFSAVLTVVELVPVKLPTVQWWASYVVNLVCVLCEFSFKFDWCITVIM